MAGEHTCAPSCPPALSTELIKGCRRVYELLPSFRRTLAILSFMRDDRLGQKVKKAPPKVDVHS